MQILPFFGCGVVNEQIITLNPRYGEISLRKARGDLSFETIHRRVVYCLKIQEDIWVDR